jgi:hypothetical protein
VLRTVVLFLLIVAPAVVRAEVMDKEAGFSDLVLLGVLGIVGAYLAARYRPWFLVALFFYPGLFFVAHLMELLDPSVGPAMRTELGSHYWLYSALSWLAPAISLATGLLGYLVRRRVQVVAQT